MNCGMARPAVGESKTECKFCQMCYFAEKSKKLKQSGVGIAQMITSGASLEALVNLSHFVND